MEGLGGVSRVVKGVVWGSLAIMGGSIGVRVGLGRSGRGLGGFRMSSKRI